MGYEESWRTGEQGAAHKRCAECGDPDDHLEMCAKCLTLFCTWCLDQGVGHSCDDHE